MKRKPRRAVKLAAAAVFVAASCTSGIFNTPAEVRGVWKTDGYGRVLDIRERSFSIYDQTASTCTLSERMDFAGPVFEDYNLFVSEGGRVLRYREKGDPHLVRADRLPSLPADCVAGADSSAQSVFTAFAETMATHYAFFDIYGVDWSGRVARAQKALEPEMAENALFDLMAGMLTGIHDDHLSLSAAIDGKRRVALPGRSRISTAVADGRRKGDLSDDFRFLETYWSEWVLAHVLKGRGSTGANGQVAWGVLDGSIGYLGLRMLTDFASHQGAEADALDRAMESALQTFRNAGAEAVLIDLAANPGGRDAHARSVAARFTDAACFAFDKRAADASSQAATRITLAPARGTRFNGPVGVVTTELTASAAEVLVLALRARQGGILQIGEPTAGAFSDVLDRRLPNGWSLGLSNEVYRDTHGQSWEGRGLQPEHAIEIFDLENLTVGHSAAIRTAAELMRSSVQITRGKRG